MSTTRSEPQWNERLATEKIRPPSLLLFGYRVHLTRDCAARIVGRKVKQAQSPHGAKRLHAMTVPAVLKGNQSGQG